MADRITLQVARYRPEEETEVTFQDYVHPEYPQRYPGFVSHLSAIDFLFCAGPRLDLVSPGA